MCVLTKGKKLITRQKVHALLRKSGLTKHTTGTTAIKGWRNHYSGYDVREDGDYIYVEWYCGDHFVSRENKAKRRASEIGAYLTVLGFFGATAVEDGGYSNDELRVRIPKA